MSNYPDGWSREDEIAAGIAERHPGFESFFEACVEEMEEDYYSLPDAEQTRIYDELLEEFLSIAEDAKVDRYLADLEDRERGYDYDYDR